jgi:hypothetical protein
MTRAIVDLEAEVFELTAHRRRVGLVEESFAAVLLYGVTKRVPKPRVDVLLTTVYGQRTKLRGHRTRVFSPDLASHAIVHGCHLAKDMFLKWIDTIRQWVEMGFTGSCDSFAC